MDQRASNLAPGSDDSGQLLTRGFLLLEIPVRVRSLVMLVGLMIVLPFPIGWFVRHRLTAYVAYLAAFSFLFTFQSIMLIIEWAGGDTRAFGSFPKADDDTYSYGLVNLGFLVVGLGLLTLGTVLASRRRARRAVPTAAHVAA